MTTPENSAPSPDETSQDTDPAPDYRTPLLAFAYELIVGDVAVDTWEETMREVTAVSVTSKNVTVTFEDGTTETTSMRPGYQKMYDILRWASEVFRIRAQASGSTSV